MKINPPFPTVYGIAPREGTRAARIDLAFPTDNGAVLDLSLLQQTGELRQCQTLYIDNSANDSALMIQSEMMLQAVKIPAGGQGYIPILAPNPPRFSIMCASANSVAYVFALNYSVPPAQWGVSSGSSGGNVTVTNFPNPQAVSQSGNWSVQNADVSTHLGNHNFNAIGSATLINAPSGGFINLNSFSIFLDAFTCSNAIQFGIGFNNNNSLMVFIPIITTAYTGYFYQQANIRIANTFGAAANLTCSLSLGPMTGGFCCVFAGAN